MASREAFCFGGTRNVPSQEKIDKVSQIEKWFEKTDSLLVLRYRGLSVSEANELRGQVSGLSGELRVLKNTLTRIAIADTGKEGIAEFMDGPVAVVFTNDDPAPLARVVRDFSKGRKEFFLLGGLLEGRVLDAGQVESFAMLPPREVLIARMLGQMKSPLAGAVGVCAGPIRKLLGLFSAIVESRGPQEAPAPPSEEPAVAPEETAGVAEATDESEQPAVEAETEQQAGESGTKETPEAEEVSSDDAPDEEPEGS